MKLKSRAKINLFLHVTGKMPSGYHELQSIFYFPDIYDEIEISESRKNKDSIFIDGSFGESLKDDVSNNIIIQTINKLRQEFNQNLPFFEMGIKKNLPVASGIGGGSANAAAIIRYIKDQYINNKINDQKLKEFAASIGADVPPCVFSKPCFVEGIGDEISYFENFPKLNVLLVNPLVQVSTKDIFSAGFKRYSKKVSKPEISKQSELVSFLKDSSNDLQENAVKACPEISVLLDNLEQTNPLLFRMSGSGATCFALYESKKDVENAQKFMEEKYKRQKIWIAVG